LDKQPNAWGASGIVRAVVAASFSIATMLAASTAVHAAEGTPTKAELAAAKKHYGEGDKKYKAGDFAGALVEFKAANDIKATPQAERYIGMTEDNLGHYAAAAEWYDKFLAHVPDKLATEGEEIKKRDAEIKAMPGKVHIESVPPGANVSIDEKPQSSPAPLDVELPPGAHALRLTEQGRLPAEKTIDVAFASSQSVSVPLEEAPPPPPAPPPPVAVAPAPLPPPPPPPEPRSKLPAFITGGLAVAAAGVGTAFGVMALNDKSQFDKTPTTQIADNGDTHSLIADMSFGVAITFGVTSAVLFLTRDEAPAAASQAASETVASARPSVTVTPTPLVGPHSGGAGLVLQF
jgi:hypothetical protein